MRCMSRESQHWDCLGENHDVQFQGGTAETHERVTTYTRRKEEGKGWKEGEKEGGGKKEKRDSQITPQSLNLSNYFIVSFSSDLRSIITVN